MCSPYVIVKKCLIAILHIFHSNILLNKMRLFEKKKKEEEETHGLICNVQRGQHEGFVGN